MKKVSSKRLPIMVFGLSSLLLSIWCFFIRIDDIKGSFLIHEQNLLTTNGVIITSETYKEYDIDLGMIYYYRIAYEFKVDNIFYQSNQIIASRSGSTSPDFAKEYIAKYPKGKQVTVYYEKGNASFSLLEPDVRDKTLIIIPIAVIFSIATILWACIGLHNTTADKAT